MEAETEGKERQRYEETQGWSGILPRVEGMSSSIPSGIATFV